MMTLASLVATWSKDPSTKVGAVIVDQKNRVVSLGFNGFPRSVKDSADVTREVKLMCTIHAEENALLFASRSVAGCTVYVTHPPCAKCAAKLVQAEIARVVTVEPPSDFLERWKDDLACTHSMFKEAGVSLEYF